MGYIVHKEDSRGLAEHGWLIWRSTIRGSKANIAAQKSSELLCIEVPMQ